MSEFVKENPEVSFIATIILSTCLLIAFLGYQDYQYKIEIKRIELEMEKTKMKVEANDQ